MPAGVWPAPYDGAYLFSDYVCGKIFRLVPQSGGGFSAVDFATGLGGSSAVAMTFGPFNGAQALYYTTYAGGGQVRRISYLTANSLPTALASVNPNFGPVPLAVTFSGAGSSDPDENYPLTYVWDFGDGSASVETASVTTGHTYNAAGVFTATLTVRDTLGGLSAPATVRVYPGNTPPVLTILSPAPSSRFAVGQILTLQGRATDNGTDLPPSALTWQVLLHHVDETNPGTEHTHPYFGPASGNNLPFTAPPPEDLNAAALSYLEIQLTAADAEGLGATVTQTLQPQRVNVTFKTEPGGLGLIANGVNIPTPKTLVSWEGYALNMLAPVQLDNQGKAWAFHAWSDGGEAARTIVTPPTAVTYTATFTPAIPMWFPLLFK